LAPARSWVASATRGLAIAELLLANASVFAQVVDSGSLQRQQQLAQPPPAPPLSPKLPLLEMLPRESTPLEPGGKLFVHAFKLAAPSPLLDDTQLSTLLKDFSGRENSFEELNKAATTVADALRARGFAFVRVLVPEQEVLDGVVALEIVPGRLSIFPNGRPDITVKRKGRVRLRDTRAMATVAASLHPDSPALTLPEVERGLLDLNRLPGVQGTGVLVPGLQPNTLGLALELQEGPLVSGYADIDDYGSRTTGSVRAVADLRLNDPLGRGDSAELNLAKSTGTSSETASVIQPILDSGLRARVAASLMQYHLLKEFSALDAKGDSTWYSAGLTYPQERGRLNNFTWTGSFDFKQLQDQSGGLQTSSRRSAALSGGAQGSYQFADNSTVLDYGFTLLAGKLDRGGDFADMEVDRITRRSQGIYAILRGNVSWQQRLTPRLSLFAAAQAQRSSRDLDTSEKLYLGGPHGVRAYPSEEAGSDSAAILNTELRWLMRRSPTQDWTAFALFDAGRADLNQHTWGQWNAKDPSLRNTYVLKGYGVGVRANIGSRVQIEVVEARKLGSNPGASATGQDADGTAKKNRLWAVVSFSF
jgi:hemolysin activation/secretion protein